MTSRNPAATRTRSILDARVITGPTLGLVQFARHLPPHAHLHIALLSPDADTPLPPISLLARSARLSVRRRIESHPSDPRVIPRACDIARATGATIIQSHTYKPYLIALAQRRLLGIPRIGLHQGWTAENFKVRVFQSINRVMLPRADRVVAVSSDSEQLSLDAGCTPSHTTMIADAVDAADFTCAKNRTAIRHAWGALQKLLAEV